MKKITEVNNDKMPKVKIDKSLNQYQGKIIFKSTFAKAQAACKNFRILKDGDKSEILPAKN
jgi:hypothetical protein